MTKLNKGRTGKPIVLSAGIDTRHVPLARNNLPAQEQSAYAALFEVALRYSPDDAAEGLAMILSVCMRTLGKTELVNDTVDLKTGVRYRTRTLMENLTEPEKAGPGKRKLNRKRPA